MKLLQITQIFKKTGLAAVALIFSTMLFSTIVSAEDQSNLANTIEKVDYSSLPGGRVAVRITTTKPLANPPVGFTINNPPRISLDFLETANGLKTNSLKADQGILKSINFAQAKNRTRMVLNLSKSVAYNTTVKDKETTIILQSDVVPTGDINVVARFSEKKMDGFKNELKNVDFARGKNGEGRIIVDLADANAGIDIKQKGKTIVVDFINADIAANLQRRLNVTNFNTPVVYVDTLKQGKNVHMVIEPQGLWEQSAYQADKRFIIDIKPIIVDPNKLVQGSKGGYTGEKLSLNFQNIEVRSVLNVIADFTGLNIITSDSVTGNLTLKLKDVPWDQALDIIMKSKNLTMRKNGTVIVVAPTDEVNAKEKSAAQQSAEIADLEPLVTESFVLKYLKAQSFRDTLTGESQSGGSSGSSGSQNRGILSKRGSAVIDVRTNTLIIQDIPRKLEEIQAVINKLDIAVRQVMIESRIVLADDRFNKALGARFGVTHRATPLGTSLTTSGTLGNRPTDFTVGPPATFTQGLRNGTIQTGLSNSFATSSDGQPDLMSNLPVANAFGNLAFSVMRLPAGFLLNLELSALESDKRGKVVSSPRVTTANQQKASIQQGTKIPYLQASSSGATNVAFVDATLALEVTPQITPEDKIIMDLEVRKDRVGQVFAGVPSIETQRVKTQVLVDNGETAVLGGIFEQTERNDVDKVPFFGDLPFVGNVFKRKTKQDEKTELLIFVTPKVMDESLSIR